MQATNVEASAIVIGAHKGGTSNSKVVAMSVHRVVTFKSDPFLLLKFWFAKEITSLTNHVCTSPDGS